MRSGIIRGSAAASPHIPTGIPAALPAEMIFFIERRTDGWKAEYRYATLGLPLSTLIVYCVRSLVPIEKKSDSLASLSAIREAEAVSIIHPTSMSLS